MLDMDPPPHNALRAIVNRDFTPRAVRMFTERIREIFDDVLDEALEKGEVEFVDDVAAKLPMRVFAEMLGAPEGDHRYLVELGDRMLGQDDPEYAHRPRGGGGEPPPAVLEPRGARDVRVRPQARRTSGASAPGTTSSPSSSRPRSTAAR